MSYKSIFGNWRGYLTEQSNDGPFRKKLTPEEEEAELDAMLKSIQGEDGKSSGRLPTDDEVNTAMFGPGSGQKLDKDWDFSDAPYEKFSKKRRTDDEITAILIHESDAFGDIDQFNQKLSAKGFSVNHVVMEDGTVHTTIPNEYATIHAGKWNKMSIGIEVHHHLGTKKFEGQKPISGPWTLKKPYYVPTVEQLEATYQLCAELCREYDIPLRVSNVVNDMFDMEMPYKVLPGQYETYPKGHEKEGQFRMRKGKKIPKTVALPKLNPRGNTGIIAHGACQGNRIDGILPCYYMALRLRGLGANEAREKTKQDFDKNRNTTRHLKTSKIKLPTGKMGPEPYDIGHQIYHDPRVSDFIDE